MAAAKTDILIVDEPTVGIDVKTKGKFTSYWLKLRARASRCC